MNKKQVNRIINKLPIYIVILFNVIAVFLMLKLCIDSSGSLGLVKVIPIIMLLNIFMGFLFKVLNSEYYFLFYGNIIINPIVMIIGLYWSVDICRDSESRDKRFYINNSTYYIIFDDIKKKYTIINNQADKIIDGEYIILENNRIKLDKNMFILNDSINNFPNDGDKVKLEKFY